MNSPNEPGGGAAKDASGSSSSPAPQCLVVTGPARKETWASIERKIRAIRDAQPLARLAILAADADLGQLRAIARNYAPIEIRRLIVPCACCPALTELAAEAKQLTEETRPDWLLLELPAMAATALLAHFDSALQWRRQFVVCLDSRWTEMRQADQLNWFQTQLLQAADSVELPQ